MPEADLGRGEEQEAENDKAPLRDRGDRAAALGAINRVIHARTEIDALNGAICVLGKEKGIATPVNDTITSLIRYRENRNID